METLDVGSLQVGSVRKIITRTRHCGIICVTTPIAHTYLLINIRNIRTICLFANHRNAIGVLGTDSFRFGLAFVCIGERIHDRDDDDDDEGMRMKGGGAVSRG